MDQVLLWGSQNYELLTGIGLGIGILFVIVFPFVVYRRPRVVQLTGEAAVVKRAEYIKQERERRLRERLKISEMFEEGLLILYSRSQISNSAYQYWHGKFKTLACVADFENVKIVNPEELKELLRKRRNGGTYHGIYARVDLPIVKEVRVDALEAFISNFKR